MSLEKLEINKDTLAKDTFLSMLANVSEVYNTLLSKEAVTLEDATKILAQIMEAYSFYNTIKQSELTQELSDARIQLDQIATTFQNLEQFKGEKGDKGENGSDGADGTPFTFDMFTPEQLELLRGIQGERGEKGLDGTMTFEDLTPEQIALLKGEKGDNGIDGTPFTYDMFTPEQLALLKGVKGDKGDDGVDGQNGNDFTFDMFTPEQLALLKGVKGDTGEAGTTDYNLLENLPVYSKILQTKFIARSNILSSNILYSTGEKKITNLPISITPKSNNSTLIMFFYIGYYPNANNQGYFTILARKKNDNSLVFSFDPFGGLFTFNTSAYIFNDLGHQVGSSVVFQNVSGFKDILIEFDLYFKCLSPSCTTGIQCWGSECGHIILMEIEND